MTSHEISRRFPNASAAFARRNSAPSGAVAESAVCDGAVAKSEGEIKHSSRFAVSVKSYRLRLLDPDNLCPKYFIDGLRYAGLIPDDRSEDIELAVTQEKVARAEDERTVVTITELNSVESALAEVGAKVQLL